MRPRTPAQSLGVGSRKPARVRRPALGLRLWLRVPYGSPAGRSAGRCACGKKGVKPVD